MTLQETLLDTPVEESIRLRQSSKQGIQLLSGELPIDILGYDGDRGQQAEDANEEVPDVEGVEHCGGRKWYFVTVAHTIWIRR